MKKSFLNFAFVGALLLVAACGGGDSDFNGTFIGTANLNGVSSQVTMTLNKNGNSINGSFVSSGQGMQGTGTVTGSAQNNTITQISITFAQGQGGGGCPMTGSGTQTSGTLTLNLSACGTTSTASLVRQR